MQQDSLQTNYQTSCKTYFVRPHESFTANYRQNTSQKKENIRQESCCLHRSSSKKQQIQYGQIARDDFVTEEFNWTLYRSRETGRTVKVGNFLPTLFTDSVKTLD